ncbi:MAG: hypothetical protein NZM12_12375, partial [Steroidobacteraceae bacterium]|nr:hypothetical protein [Steroidobacteraceae bacterium]
MSNQESPELLRYLERYPQTRFFDCFLSDLNGIGRGKRIDRSHIATVWSAGMPLPGSMFALDVLGGTVQASGLGF